MISDDIKALLHGAPALYFATHDERLLPCVTRVQGVKVKNGQDLDLVLAKPISQPTLSNLAKDGHFAFTACDISNFSTYQFKGVVSAVEEAGTAEMTLKELYLAKFQTALVSLGYPESFVAGFAQMRTYVTPAPAWVLRAKVEEIFLQTPGPGAGKRLWPAA